MGRKGRVSGQILTFCSLLLCSCAIDTEEDIRNVYVRFDAGRMMTRAIDPDEELISDISLMIFDETGAAEDCFWLSGGERECTARLIMDKEYTFCACANFGYQVYADHIDELEEITFHMAYPDEYREGIPMYSMEKIRITEKPEVTLNLKRLMAKISLRIDRSRLDEDVEMHVRSVRIGNCPRMVNVFTESRVWGGDDCFPAGFTRGALEASGLNINTSKGLSEEISLYMLENMQGEIPYPITSDSDKVFDRDDPMREKCSYIEMEMDYISDQMYSQSKGLIYRFYLGEDRNSLDVERNCHYHITVTPENDGLSDDGWRVDKSDLTEFGPPAIMGYPSSYIRGDIGDRIHIWCEYSPWNAPFDVGISYMEDDKAEGIYDYEIDEDGRGAVLTLTGPGCGLIYMEAGDPINDAALFIIEVNLP